MTNENFADYFELTYEKKVNVIRCIDTSLFPSDLSVKLQFQIINNFDDYYLAVLIGKIDYFFDFVVSNSIILDKDNTEMCGILLDADGFPTSDNNVILTPGDPSDALLSILFQTKITSFTNNFLDIFSIEVSSSNTIGISTKFLGNGIEHLPTNDDWFGSESWYDFPWWARNDASTMDAINYHTTDFEVPPFMKSFDEIEEMLSDIDKPNAVIVDFEQFKPRLVDDEEE